MSRNYEMTLRVLGVTLDECAQIDEILHDEGFESHFALEDGWESECTSVLLSGGVSDDDLHDRLARLIWKGLDKYVTVELDVLYVEQTPFDTHTTSEEAYAQWLTTEKMVVKSV